MKRPKAKVTKRPGGRPKRERFAIALQVSPAVAEWYAQRAELVGKNRNRVIEDVLEAFQESIDMAESPEADQFHPIELPGMIASDLFGRLVGRGVVGPRMAQAYAESVGDISRVRKGSVNRE